MKNRLNFTSILMLLGSVLTFSAHASDDMCFEKAHTQSQLTACATEALQRNDQQLNRLYKRMQARLGKDDKTRSLLIDAERKWIAFRDAECAFATVRTVDGSVHAMQLNSCLADLTRDRITALENHLACGKNADEQTALTCALPR